MSKDTRHVWFIACMCLLRPLLASFTLATNYRRGLAIPPSRTMRHVQVPIYEAGAAAYIRVQLRTYTRTTLRTYTRTTLQASS